MALSIPFTFSAHTLIQAANVNSNFTTIVNYINGSLELAADHATDFNKTGLGVVASNFNTSTAPFTTLSTEATIQSVTFTAVAARRYMIVWTPYAATATIANDRFEFRIKNGSTQLYAQRTMAPVAAIEYPLPTLVTWQVPGAGSVTYNITALRQAGTGTTSAVAGTATTPWQLVVMDVGL